MAYFVLCIFLSAFLIFQVQPLIAKYILPWFGGAPAVWSTVQMFFQVLLTGGYAYAAWVGRPGRGREKWHIALLGLSAFLLLALGLGWRSPITPDAAWKPSPDASPVLEILRLLSISVGLPYFLLASNSPLMQAWFHRLFPTRTAYRLYALSNVGSLLGLVTYPLLVEPYVTLPAQGWIWSLLYLGYAGLAVLGAVRSLHVQVAPAAELALPPVTTISGVSRRADAVSVAGGPTASIRWQDFVLWPGLAAAASILLLAVTSHLTQEVAVIPFLWVLPLTIYLLTFILSFSGERWYSRQVFLVLLFVSTILMGWALARAQDMAIPRQIGIYSLLLFSACMVCHGELYRLRPPPARLTVFYLFVSVGGALGGIFITFVAPRLFRGYWEMLLGLAFVWLLFLFVNLRRREHAGRWRFVCNQGLLVSALALSVVFAVQYIQADLASSLLLERSFYGVVRVKLMGTEDKALQRYALVHGTTIHGFQYADATRRTLPTAYYTETGGGLAILHHPRRGLGMRVGVLGLGIGTMAVYGQEGDVYRFYEINPQVIALAEGQGGYFSYLTDSQAHIEVVAGDARLSLERELAAGQRQDYDVLALDVFSSDSIPVHLLNREAFALYLEHLAPDGILAVHISNRHLDLLPVVWQLAEHYDLARVVIGDDCSQERCFPSLWVLLAREPALLAVPEIASRARDMGDYTPSLRLWTDDYSNLIQILK